MRKAIIPYLPTQYLLGLVADQCPGNMQTSYWIDFMGRPTPFASGPEKGARSGHLPAVFAAIDKPRRSHYHATIKLACMDAAELPEGDLTAILALTEELTLISQNHVTDAIYEQAAKLFDEQYLSQLIMCVIVINGWNRLGITTHMSPAAS